MSLIQFLGAIEIGLVFGLVGLGVFLSFRVLNFPDLTVDGSFPLGAAVCATLIVHGVMDLIAPVRDARRLEASVQGDVEVVIYPTGNHTCTKQQHLWTPLVFDFFVDNLQSQTVNHDEAETSAQAA